MKVNAGVKIVAGLLFLIGVLGIVAGIVVLVIGLGISANEHGGWMFIGPPIILIGLICTVFSLCLIAISRGLYKSQYWAYKAGIAVMAMISLLAWVFLVDKSLAIITIAVNAVLGMLLFLNRRLFIDRKSRMDFAFLGSFLDSLKRVVSEHTL